MEELGRVPLMAVLACRIGIDRTPVGGQHDAVIALRARAAYKAAENISKYAFCFAVERVAPSAAPTGFNTHDVAAAQDVAVAERREQTFIVPAGVDNTTA